MPSEEHPSFLYGPELEGADWPSAALAYWGYESCIDTGKADSGECRPPQGLDFKATKKFILDCYPGFVNDTCGFHIHMSFGLEQNKWLFTLADDDFFPYFCAEALNFAYMGLGEEDRDNFIYRLHGKNHHTKKYSNLFDKLFLGDFRDGDMIHYNPKHNTVEFRLAPMFKSRDTAVVYLNWLRNTVFNFLVKKRAMPKNEVKDLETQLHNWGTPYH